MYDRRTSIDKRYRTFCNAVSNIGYNIRIAGQSINNVRFFLYLYKQTIPVLSRTSVFNLNLNLNLNLNPKNVLT